MGSSFAVAQNLPDIGELTWVRNCINVGDMKWPLLVAQKLLFSHLVVSDILQSHRLQHIRPLCHSQSPRVCPGSCSLYQCCHLTISSSVAFSPAFSLSHHQGLFHWVSSSHQVTKYWSSSFSISPSSESSGLISFRMDWFDLLACLRVLLVKSLLQHHSLKVTILWCSAFCMARLSHLFVTIGKTIDSTM